MNKIDLKINNETILKNMMIKTTDNFSKVCVIKNFSEKSENIYTFNVNDTIKGELVFENKAFATVVSLKMKILHETSYTHNKFIDGGISVTFNTEKDGNFLAHHNYNGWWTRPEFYDCEKAIPDDTQILSWQNNTISYVLQTLCDEQFKTVINGKDGSINVKLISNTSGYSVVDAKLFVLAYDKNPYKAFENAMQISLNELDTTNCDRNKRHFPDIFNYLGFCTWNAFYSNVNHDGVLKKSNEFVEKNLPVKWFLIDHGWSQAENEQLTSFKEDFEKFPGGLKNLKTELQKRGVSQVGVWQGFGGHWGTIKSGSTLHEEMKNELLQTNTGDIIPNPLKEKSFTFWNKWHRYLKQQGIDFVKVDIQSSLSSLTEGLLPIGKAAKEAHLGLEASVGVNFDGALINCMGMAMEQVLNRPISGLSRNSNDFFPHKQYSFKKHVMENAYNTLYHGNVFYGDWDMWWTNHADSLNNSYLRALSGGPLYISDCISKTDASKIMPHILENGFVLRCENQGIITKDQIFIDPSKHGLATKVCNIKGNTAYIAAFNCCLNENSVTAKISAHDMRGLKEAEKYLVYDYTNKMSKVVLKDECCAFTLSENQSIFLSFTPIKNGVAILGSTDKLISSAVISENIGNLYVLSYGGEILLYNENDIDIKINGELIKVVPQNNIYQFLAPKEKIYLEIVSKKSQT